MKDQQEILSKYICPIPFNYTEVTINNQLLCCSEWLDGDIGSSKTIGGNWKSEKAEKIRESILDGTYKYCSTSKCPHLNTLLKTGKPTYGLVERSKFNLTKETWNKGPKELKVVFDSACNLACPSCRVDFIQNSPRIYKDSVALLEDIKKEYSTSLETLHMSGYGDPFYSKALFEFLTNFNTSWLPKLRSIHLHTNGLLWNERNWEKIKNSHHLIKSCEISIDAAKSSTYSQVRKGGNFDLLLKNLIFVNTLDTVQDIIVSFVVQQANYREVIDFYKLITSIFKNKPNIRFHYYKILNWGVMSEESFNKAAVWKEEHPEFIEYSKYIKELQQLNDPRVIFNT